MAVKISVSLLGADLMNLREGVKQAEDALCDEFHFDVMDGQFVDHISMGHPILSSLRSHTDVAIDAHMMVNDPLKFVKPYSKICDLYTFHIESKSDPKEVINVAKEEGLMAGIAINPATNLEKIEHIFEMVKRVLVMAVVPGYAGQEFIEDVLDKVSYLSELKKKYGLSYKIGVDGGIKVENAHKVVSAGGEVLIVATGLYKYKGGVKEAMSLLRNSA